MQLQALNGTVTDVLDPMVFDTLEPVHIQVTIGKQRYYAVEASEAGAVAYRRASMMGARMEGDSVFVGDVAEAEPVLVSQCLYRANAEGNLPLVDGRLDDSYRVPLDQVKRWSHAIVGPLFDRIKTISKLDVAEETVEAIDKQIAKLQRKRQKLLEKRPDPTTAASS